MASRGNIKTAIASVRQAKWRSLLTMTGIIIGIVSVVTTVSIGEGVKRQIVGQVNSLGRDLIVVRPGNIRSNSGLAGVGGVAPPTAALTDADLHTVTETIGVRYSSPLAVVGTGATGDIKYDSSPIVIGASADLPLLLNQKVDYGEFFTPDDTNQYETVIGSKVANDLFVSEVPLGSSLQFHGKDFLVHGIFHDFATTPLSAGANFNNAIFIPYQVAQSLSDNRAPIYEILVKANSSKETDAVISRLQKNLQKNRGGQVDFSVERQSENAAVNSGVLSLLTRLVAGIAAISLLVGGVGIMDVMLVSVTERMHEIGIRKAIGATNRQIMNQFITEASVLSIGGGILGVILSLLIDLLLHIFTHLAPVITWQTMLIAVGVSLAVGIIFGSAPALKAARKDPIEALRNE